MINLGSLIINLYFFLLKSSWFSHNLQVCTSIFVSPHFTGGAAPFTGEAAPFTGEAAPFTGGAGPFTLGARAPLLGGRAPLLRGRVPLLRGRPPLLRGRPPLLPIQSSRGVFTSSVTSDTKKQRCVYILYDFPYKVAEVCVNHV